MGITGHDISSLPTNNKREPLADCKATRVAVKFPSVPYVPYAKLHTTSLGASFYKNDSLLCDSIQYQLARRHPYNPLEAGSTPGMQGGGYFNKGSLLGIVAGMMYRTCWPVGNAIPLPLDEVLSVPLFTHKEWIEKTLADYKKQLPALMLKSHQWDIDSDQHELIHDSIKQYLIKFITQDYADRTHEKQPLKKPILDKLAQKICELYPRHQDARLHALYAIYLAFKQVDLDSEASLKSYQDIYKENVGVLKTFDTGSIKRKIGSLFSSETDTYKLITKLNEFIEKNSYPSEKMKYHVRYGECC